jgi:hypothetical protein
MQSFRLKFPGPGVAGFRMWGKPWAGDRMPFGYCRNMNGHQDVHVPEILGE